MWNMNICFNQDVKNLKTCSLSWEDICWYMDTLWFKLNYIIGSYTTWRTEIGFNGITQSFFFNAKMSSFFFTFQLNGTEWIFDRIGLDFVLDLLQSVGWPMVWMFYSASYVANWECYIHSKPNIHGNNISLGDQSFNIGMVVVVAGAQGVGRGVKWRRNITWQLFRQLTKKAISHLFCRQLHEKILLYFQEQLCKRKNIWGFNSPNITLTFESAPELTHYHSK